MNLNLIQMIMNHLRLLMSFLKCYCQCYTFQLCFMIDGGLKVSIYDIDKVVELSFEQYYYFKKVLCLQLVKELYNFNELSVFKELGQDDMHLFFKIVYVKEEELNMVFNYHFQKYYLTYHLTTKMVLKLLNFELYFLIYLNDNLIFIQVITFFKI